MDQRKQRALEDAGWRFGDAADFLEMTAEERHFLERKIDSEQDGGDAKPPIYRKN
jgi:hypothetical protein